MQDFNPSMQQQHSIFPQSSIKTELSSYGTIPATSTDGNYQATDDTEPGSNLTNSPDQIFTAGFYDFTPLTSFAYYPISTDSDSRTLNPQGSTYECVNPLVIGSPDVNILGGSQNPGSWVGYGDAKYPPERTVVFPTPSETPPWCFPLFSGDETVGGAQVLNQHTHIEDPLDMNGFDGPLLMKMVGEPNQQTCHRVTSFPLESVYNYDGHSEGQFIPNWWERHPNTWTPSEVLDWIKISIHRDYPSPSYPSTEGFKDLESGVHLCHMTYEEFLIRDPQYGHHLYYCLKELLDFYTNSSKFAESQSLLSSKYSGVEEPHIDPFSLCSRTPVSPPTNPFNTTQNGPDHTTTTTYTDLIVPKYQSQCNELGPGLPVDTYGYLPQTGSSNIPLKRIEQFESPKRKPGRPRLHPCFKSNGTSNKKMKILPLWEFIYSMLKNNRFNPSIIKWEDEANGKFRFVHSERFAKLWGNAKNNDNMNYEKLSRAMRHYYGKDIMERVEGRRLVYRFLKPALERLRKKRDPEMPLSETQRPPEVNHTI